MGAQAKGLASIGVASVLLLAGATTGSAEARPQAGACSVALSLPAPPALRPHYALSVRVRADLRVAQGTLAVTFTAPSERGTDRLVFRLWPNGPRYASKGARLSVSRVRQGKRTLTVSRPNPTTLVVGRRLSANERTVVSMDWRLVLPREKGLRLKAAAARCGSARSSRS